ncbi:hypothetical protein PENSPDRAFT_680846 [Peniophora sp. CONT]|nr:hypothetical protein PENSPDRAFT_680846 [Peniophora sp. CONT]
MNALATDSWDSPVASSSTPVAIARAPVAIKDDWDDSEESEPEDSKKIWEAANTKAPLPQLVATPTSTSSAPALPSGAFAAPIRILKRTPTGSGSSTPSTASQQPTYADKKAQYDAARQRIFAAEEQAKNPASEKLPEKTAVLRQPLGPTSGEDSTETASSGSKGFAKRSRGRSSGQSATKS